MWTLSVSSPDAVEIRDGLWRIDWVVWVGWRRGVNKAKQRRCQYLTITGGKLHNEKYLRSAVRRVIIDDDGSPPLGYQQRRSNTEIRDSWGEILFHYTNWYDSSISERWASKQCCRSMQWTILVWRHIFSFVSQQLISLRAIFARFNFRRKIIDWLTVISWDGSLKAISVTLRSLIIVSFSILPRTLLPQLITHKIFFFFMFVRPDRSRQVMSAVAIHRQTLPARSRSDDWRRVWCTNDYDRWQADQVADLGWVRNFSFDSIEAI